MSDPAAEEKAVRRTRIIATIGPASSSQEKLDAMVAAGMDMARLNFSHGKASDHTEVADRVRQAAAKAGRRIGILADLQGPKIRIGKFINNEIMLQRGDSFVFDVAMPLDQGSQERIGITYPKMIKEVSVGNRLLLNDGVIAMRVKAIQDSCIHCEVELGGKLSNNKGINCEGGGFAADALTDKDRQDLLTAVALNADYIAVSFVRNAADLELARGLIQQAGGHARLVAKIERAEAMNRLEEIMTASDAIMVARGDLGIEIGDAEVPPAQKRMLRMAPRYNCPVIVATQMLESMTDCPIPTRAEASDVASAVVDGADAVMLSGESASGHYPVEAVAKMEEICLRTEHYNVVPSGSLRKPHEANQRIDECIGCMAMETAEMMAGRIKAVVALTQKGSSVLYMSRHLSKVPIYAFTPEENTLGYLTLYRNVVAHKMPNNYGPRDAPKATRDVLNILKEKVPGLNAGDMVVLTLGTPMGQAGTTNTMKIVEVDGAEVLHG